MSKKEKETEIMIFPPLFKKKKRQFQSATPGVCEEKTVELIKKLKKKHIL